ncbi:MAG: alpha-L-arabinofuranosidase [Candidatus Omnitrophica bacterium]|nr:alpha-L-arabinofuranosidase [Candidatus Omnitrophota bacterium]
MKKRGSIFRMAYPAGILLAVSCAIETAASTDARISIQADQPGTKISPLLWGIFFEDINHSADGGIYPEQVRNRSFEDSDQPDHWALETTGSAAGEMAIDSSKPLNPLNRRGLRLKITGADAGKVRLVNRGYWGMAVSKNSSYRFSMAARCGEGFTGPLNVALESQSGQTLAEGTIGGLRESWQTFTLDLAPLATNPRAALVISPQKNGTVWLDMVSLLPKNTWKGHGLRPDLAGMLAGLKPSFVRFPGGCWVEGDELKYSYHWKDTIGDIAHRQPLWNIWQYHATQGLGFHDYLQLCEDLGAEPLFVINVGMSHREVVPMDQMGQWVQDALDAIEYANGPVQSVWGGLRARNGHPAPFNLKYLEIGNENSGPVYQERYALFYDAIKARYPTMKLIADVPTEKRPSDLVDEHYYSSPEFFINHAEHYDTYDRQGPRVYVGEYAVTQNCGQGNLRGALGEAAFMTGIERNADLVVMASYAPLFANVNYKKWNPDLIDFDSAGVYGIPSYYVQKMFSENRGDVVLPADIEISSAEHEDAHHGGIGLGTWEIQAEFKLIHDVTYPSRKPLFAAASRVSGTGEILLKTVNVSPSPLQTEIDLRGVQSLQPAATEIVLTSPDPADENSLAAPNHVAPVQRTFTAGAPRFEHTFPAYSLTILRLRAER